MRHVAKRRRATTRLTGNHLPKVVMPSKPVAGGRWSFHSVPVPWRRTSRGSRVHPMPPVQCRQSSVVHPVSRSPVTAPEDSNSASASASALKSRYQDLKIRSVHQSAVAAAVAYSRPESVFVGREVGCFSGGIKFQFILHSAARARTEQYGTGAQRLATQRLTKGEQLRGGGE